MVIGEGQQCQKACALDRGVELALIDRLRSGQTCRNNLAVFLNEITQGIEIFVINLIDVCCAKAAKFTTFE